MFFRGSFGKGLMRTVGGNSVDVEAYKYFLCQWRAETFRLLIMTQGQSADASNRDQTAQNVQSDLDLCCPVMRCFFPPK